VRRLARRVLRGLIAAGGDFMCGFRQAGEVTNQEEELT
jgi:hypothetical protein